MQPQCGRRWCSRNFLQNQMEEGLVSEVGGEKSEAASGRGETGQKGTTRGPQGNLRRVMKERKVPRNNTGVGISHQELGCLAVCPRDPQWIR